VKYCVPRRLGKRNTLLAITVGGWITGTLDLLQICMRFRWHIPLVIAAGLLFEEAVASGRRECGYVMTSRQGQFAQQSRALRRAGARS
jgi:hypothetical protein